MAANKLALSDKELIPRVKQYLDENVHKTYVDVDEMTQSLMTRYMDYARRKQHPFRASVLEAYKTVLRSYGIDSNPGSDNENAGSDLEVMDEPANGNHLNDALMSMYAKKPASVVTSTDEPAISIDISSDEEEDGGKATQIPAPVATEASKPTGPKVTHPTNGTKSTESAFNNIGADNVIYSTKPSRPGPASQKKRRMEEDPDSAAVPPANAQPLSGAKPKKFKKEVYAKKSDLTFADVGGVDKALKELCELILHIKHPEMYKHIGLPPPRGFLLHGAPGCGKTLLAHAIAGQLDVLLVEVPATELVAGVSGESEERIREIFEQAAQFAPCVLFIDEIDAISSNRQQAQKDMERRIVSQLLASLDNLSKLKFGDQVLVIGATNRPDSLDPALRRVGRFDHEISLGIPDRQARTQILQIISRNLKLERPFDFDEIASLTPGYVGADLLALATRAASTAIKRVITDKESKSLEIAATQPVVEAPVVEASPVKAPVVKTPPVETPVAQNNNIDEESLLMDVDEEEKSKTETTNVVENNSAETTPENAPEETKIVEEPAAELIPEVDTAMDTQDGPAKPEEENIIEVIKQQPGLKAQLTLDNMIKWLQNDVQPMTGEELESLAIKREDFLDAVKHVQPSAKREGFITVPDVTWDDIGSLQDIRSELKLAILAPVKFPEKLKKLGLNSPSGVLLCGPPGCGKTLLAKAVANEAGINFISVKGPELLNMYVGESERAVRQCFQRARNSAPCVIFFDEFDSLCPKRSDSGENSSQRVVNQLLTEMDGIEDRKGVFLMAATNRPDIVDPAVLRPGRLDKILYVGLPEDEDRVDILKALTKNGTKPELAEDVNFAEISQLTNGYTGADLAGLVRQASLQTLKESIDDDDGANDLRVYRSHFVDAINKLKPSVGEQDIKHYQKLKEKYGTHKDVSV